MTGRQMEALRDALCEAFDQDSLDQMLRLRLDIDRTHIAGPDALRSIVFKVISVALREGWQSDLIGAACAYNPGSPALRKFCDENPDLVSPGGRSESKVTLTAQKARRAPWPPRKKRGWERLRSLAEPTSRIWPLVVEGHVLDQGVFTYSLTARDPSPGGRGPEIKLGSRVFWAIQSDRDAHLLLLDDGPEGMTFCLCPSWFAPDTQLRPGATLLPPESAGCEPFVVTGIPGREELVAILSLQPLCADWMPADRVMPARVLSDEDIDQLLARLEQLPAGSWTALTTFCEVTV